MTNSIGAQRAADLRHVASTCATYLLSIFNNGHPKTRSFSVELTEEDVSHVRHRFPRFGRLTILANTSMSTFELIIRLAAASFPRFLCEPSSDLSSRAACTEPA